MNKIIKISETLLVLLKKIESSSIIAKYILELTNQENDLPLIENGIDYLSISETDSNKISYINCSRMLSTNEDDFWVSEKRFHILPGKVVSKLFSKSILLDGKISQKDIEIFSNVYRSCQIESKVKFKILTGNSIKQYYHYSTYSTNNNGDTCGSLGSSCMKYDKSQSCFSIYTNNKEISLLCLFDKKTDKLIGRSILWDIQADEINSGKQHYKIMDRIYTINDDFYSNMFKDWAKNNNYFYKHEQTYSNSIWFEKNNKKNELYLSLKINTIDYALFPYLDTFKFIDINTSTLYNYPIAIIDNLKIMNSTDGNLNNGQEFCIDDITKIIYHISDMIILEYFNNSRVYIGNTHHSYVNKCHILKSHTEFNYELDDYIFNKEYDKLNNIDEIQLILKKINKNDDKNIFFSNTSGRTYTPVILNNTNDILVPEDNTTYPSSLQVVNGSSRRNDRTRSIRTGLLPIDHGFSNTTNTSVDSSITEQPVELRSDDIQPISYENNLLQLEPIEVSDDIYNHHQPISSDELSSQLEPIEIDYHTSYGVYTNIFDQYLERLRGTLVNESSVNLYINTPTNNNG